MAKTLENVNLYYCCDCDKVFARNVNRLASKSIACQENYRHEIYPLTIDFARHQFQLVIKDN